MILIEEICKLFNECTCVPITLFNRNSEEIFKYGHTKESTDIFTSSNVSKKINTIEFTNDTYTYKYYNDTVFSIIRLYTKCRIPLYFVLGPININIHKKSNLTTKCEGCIDYLIELIFFISKDKLIKSTSTSWYSPFILNAINHIYNNYEESISVDNMCCSMNINKSYFCSKFKNETGTTFINFLNRYRIEKSKELLETTELSLFNIAISVGFQNQSYFCKTFKSFVNETPLEYRKNMN